MNEERERGRGSKIYSRVEYIHVSGKAPNSLGYYASLSARPALEPFFPL